MSEWTPVPQAYSGPPDPGNGFSRVARDIADLGRRTRDGLNHLLQAAGIRVEPGKLITEGDLDITGSAMVGGTLVSGGFDGDLAANDPGTTGWAMNPDKAAFGTILLRPGSVTNDMLANPVSGGFGNASYGSPSSPSSISTTATVYAAATITVPEGFSRAFVVAASSLAAQNASIILMETVIAGSVGPTMSVIADASGWANGSSNYAREVTGLSGSFTVASRCQAGIAGVTGMVTTSALAIFLRS